MAQKISLTRYLVEQQRADGLIPGQLRLLLEVVARACKSISQAVNKGALGGVLGTAESENVQGEIQKKLDIIANEVLIEANEWGGHLAAMASEEMDSIYVVPNRYPQGEYLLMFDPLDGSSNIDVNVSIGTIFSVLKKPDDHPGVQEADFLQAGTQQVAAGYCIYGPQTTLVLTVGNGVVLRQTLNFVSRTQHHAHPLVQFGGLQVQDALLAVGGRAAGLFDQPAHRVGFVHQAQLAGLFGLALVPRVHEDAAAHQDAVHVGHHAGDPAHVEVLAARAFLAGQAFVDVALHGFVPVAHVAHVDREFLGVGQNLDEDCHPRPRRAMSRRRPAPTTTRSGRSRWACRSSSRRSTRR